MKLSQSSVPAAGGPLVTIILSTYNWSEVLPYSIQSVLNQTFVDFELLVIGDGCTDNSAKVVDGFADPRVRWINLPKNTGSQSGPNNEGLKQARGSLIAYLGHDDLWSRYHLENLTSFCSNKKEVFATAATMWFDDVCNVLFISALHKNISLRHNANKWHTPSAIIHSRSLIEKVGFWREYYPKQDFHPDYEFFSRLDKFQPKEMIVSVSVAKVPAGRRENIYQTRDITPQKFLFEALIRNPYFLGDTAITFYAPQLGKIINIENLFLYIKRSLMSFKHILGNLGLRYIKNRLLINKKNSYEDYRRFKGLK